MFFRLAEKRSYFSALNGNNAIQFISGSVFLGYRYQMLQAINVLVLAFNPDDEWFD